MVKACQIAKLSLDCKQKFLREPYYIYCSTSQLLWESLVSTNTFFVYTLPIHTQRFSDSLHSPNA